MGVGGRTPFFSSLSSFKVLSPLSELEGCESWKRQSEGQGPQDTREGGKQGGSLSSWWFSRRAVELQGIVVVVSVIGGCYKQVVS